jgi:hypothetical protein
MTFNHLVRSTNFIYWGGKEIVVEGKGRKRRGRKRREGGGGRRGRKRRGWN